MACRHAVICLDPHGQRVAAEILPNVRIILCARAKNLAGLFGMARAGPLTVAEGALGGPQTSWSVVAGKSLFRLRPAASARQTDAKSLITRMNDLSEPTITVARAVHQLSALSFHDTKVSWATGFVIPGPQQRQLGNWVCHGRTI
jgi:hypothetical protein